jgi:hypothetical protein
MPYLKIAGVFVLLGLLYGVAQLPDHYREQGREEERAIYKKASDNAAAKAERDLKDIETQLNTERGNHAIERAKQSEKFTNYVADVRAGRVAGLRINKASICTARAEEATSTSGTVEETSVRLPRAIEEGLFRFANDRDQIILDFEAFKQEVRIAKCFAD